MTNSTQFFGFSPPSLPYSVDIDILSSFPLEEAFVIEGFVHEYFNRVWLTANLSAYSFSVFTTYNSKQIELKGLFQKKEKFVYLKVSEHERNAKNIFKMIALYPRSSGAHMYTKPRKDDYEKNAALLMREAKISAILRDAPYVLPLQCVFHRKSPKKLKALTATWCTEGNLWQYIETHFSKTAPVTQETEGQQSRVKIKLAEQMSQGLSEIHKRNFVHLDFKSSNILVDETGKHCKACICDFDRTAPKGTSIEMPVTTREYTAPEAWVEHTAATKSLDLWGLGLVLLELRYGIQSNAYFVYVRSLGENDPFQNSDYFSDLRKTWIDLREKVVGTLPHHDWYNQIIEQLLSLDPTQRPKALTVASILHNVRKDYPIPLRF